ncbi:hypothetical protein COE51_01500 [Bacillus pseudomycoides]|nr:hypothetical protein COE51_01500 [Bacillus pseudomycoides]
MLIILEGNECCYKTTIAEKLSKELGMNVVKGSSFELSQCSNEELFDHFKAVAQIDNTIIDRFIYSNEVYASLYDDYAILTNGQRKDIENLIRDKAILFYLYASDKMIKKRIEERGDDYVDTSMVSKINDKFNNSISKSGLRVIPYSTELFNSNEIVRIMVNDVKRYSK